MGAILEHVSEPSAASPVSTNLARRVRELRAARALTLVQLSERSGVSRSMISLVERNEASPTAVVLEKLASSLGVPVAALFDTATDPAPVAKRADQPVWVDPGSGYSRRNLTPATTGARVRLVEVEFPADSTVSYDSPVRPVPAHQQIWVLDGALEVTVGDTTHELDVGDCLSFEVERLVTFRTPTTRAARYLLAVSD